MEIKVNIQEFSERFKKEYEFLYNAEGEVVGEDEAVTEFDRLINSNQSFQKFVGEFAKYRKDFISSDREAAAFMFALESI